MSRAMPLYLMLKPPAAQRRALARCTSAHGLDARYGPEKYHCTLFRLGESQAWSSDMVRELCKLLGAVDAEPCVIGFDRLDGNVLRGQKGLAGLRDFQRKLAREIERLSFPVPPYRFWPHLSLAYGAPSGAKIRIEPIGWLVTEFLLVRSIPGVGHQHLGTWPLRRRQLELPLR